MIFEFGEFRSVVSCNNLSNAKTNPQNYLYSGSYNKTIMQHHIDSARAAATAAFELDTKIHEENIPNIEFNQGQIAKIKELMSFLKIPDHRYVSDPRSRARTPKKLYQIAGYLQDLNNNVRINDGYQLVKDNYDRIMKNYIALEKQAAENKAAQERLNEKTKEERKRQIELVKMIVKYKLDDDSDWYEVFEHICGLDKYVRLGMAMLSVRSDWNDGCGAVRDALDSFPVSASNSFDLEIHDAVNKAIDMFHRDQDGRVFRDCHWNYSDIFALANKELYADATTAWENRISNR